MPYNESKFNAEIDAWVANVKGGIQRSREVSVYLVQAAGRDVFKIGSSNDPEERLRSLQTSCYDDLEIVARRPNSCRCIEQSMHRLFAEKRIRGEWFKLDAGDVVQFREASNENLATGHEGCRLSSPAAKKKYRFRKKKNAAAARKREKERADWYEETQRKGRECIELLKKQSAFYEQYYGKMNPPGVPKVDDGP